MGIGRGVVREGEGVGTFVAEIGLLHCSVSMLFCSLLLEGCVYCCWCYDGGDVPMVLMCRLMVMGDGGKVASI